MRADGRDATSRHSPVGGQAQSRVAQACARTRTRTHTGAGGPSGSGLRKQACAGAPGLAGTRFQATRDGSVDAAQERRRDVLRESSGPGGPCRRGAGGQLTRNSAFRSFLAEGRTGTATSLPPPAFAAVSASASPVSTAARAWGGSACDLSQFLQRGISTRPGRDRPQASESPSQLLTERGKRENRADTRPEGGAGCTFGG